MSKQVRICACGRLGCDSETDHWSRWWALETEAWHGKRGTQPAPGAAPRIEVEGVKRLDVHDDRFSRQAWAAVLALALFVLGAFVWGVAWQVIHG